MNRTPSLRETIQLVNIAFSGMYDGAGQPYIFHLTHVAEKFKELSLQTVALLHDIVEDTDVSLEGLRIAGYSEEIVEAIDAITKRKGEEYQDYLARVKANRLARKVKLADLEHNMDRTRFVGPNKLLPKQSVYIEKRMEKYRDAVQFLSSGFN
ncbi:Bifunctional (p)ppGpp synthase/hydrolase relA [compost metagenome]